MNNWWISRLTNWNTLGAYVAFQGLVDREKPDLVIVEFVERLSGWLHEPDYLQFKAALRRAPTPVMIGGSME